jgi:ComEC/Rec2-related protein
VIRLRLITLVAVAVVVGALSAAAPATAGWTFVILIALGVAYAAQTRFPRRNLARLAIALLLFWPSYTVEKSVLLKSAPGQLQAATTLIAGTVRTTPVVETSGGTVFDVCVIAADGSCLTRPVTVRVQLPDRRQGPVLGQYVHVTGKVATPITALNPGEDSSAIPSPELFLANDVQSVASRSLVSTWGRWTARARDLVERRARSLLSYRAYGLLDELLLHRRVFGTVERQLFSATGTSHLLAISGLHLGLVFAIMTLLLGGAMSISGFGRTLAPLLATFLYLAFIDFPLSADRAFVMLCVLTLSRLRGNHVSKLTSLSWAALTLAVLDPASVFDIGLRLSFASIAGLLFIAEPLSHHIHVRSRFVRAFLLSLTSTIGASLPAVVLAIPVFHTVAPVALLANVVAIPAVSALLPILLVWSALLLIAPPLAALLAPAINLAASCLFGCLRALARLPWSHMNAAVPAPATFAVLGILFAIIILVVDNRPRLASRHYGIIPVITALVLVPITLIATASPSDTRVTFPVVERGGVVLVCDRDAGTWLCLHDTDAKAAERTVHAVAALGVNALDAVVFTGKPQDLPQQLDSLFAVLSPLRVWVPDDEVTRPIPGLDDRFQSTIQYLGPHDVVELSHADSTIRTATGATAEPILAMTAGILTGTAGASPSSDIAAPGFAYDITSGIVTVAAGCRRLRVDLDQSGCITVFMRGSHCWVAPDRRR